MDRSRSEQGLWTVGARLFGATGVLLMFLTAYMYFHYADTRPTVPEDKIGRIYPLNVHGRVIYLVRQEPTGTMCLGRRDSELHSEFRPCCPTKAEAVIGYDHEGHQAMSTRTNFFLPARSRKSLPLLRSPSLRGSSIRWPSISTAPCFTSRSASLTELASPSVVNKSLIIWGAPAARFLTGASSGVWRSRKTR